MVGHLAEDKAGERVGGADTEARIGMAHLLAETVDQGRGVCARAGFGDEVVGGAIFGDVDLDGFGEEPVEEVGEGDAEFLGDFGDGGPAFENVGDRIG